MRLPPIVRVVHPFPVATVLATSMVLLAVAGHGHVSARMAADVLSAVALSQIAVGSLNDYVDRHTDALGQPDKPLAAGELRPTVALGMALLSLAALLPLSLALGPVSCALIWSGTAAGLAYDLVMKRTRWSGAAYAAGFLSLVVWIWYLQGRNGAWLILIVPAGTLLVVAAHLAQSLPDIESDVEVGSEGLAAVLGPGRALLAVGALTLPVALGGCGLAAARGRPVALLALAPGVALVLSALAAGLSRPLDRERRLVAFHLAAPGIALIAVGSLLSIG